MALVEISCRAPAPEVEAEELGRSARFLLEELGRAGSELSLLLAGDGSLRELNLRFRGLDRATDVLSFPSAATENGAHGGEDMAGVRDSDGAHLGDIAISVESARRQAEAGGWSLQEELGRLLVHGLLHLLGFDHERGGEEELRMKAEELRLAALLEAAGLPCAGEEGR